MTDELICEVEKYLNGDKSSFNQIYKQTSKQIYSICLSYLKNKHDARDMASEVYISVLEKIESLKDRTKFVAWIKMIARNECLDYIKKKKPAFLDDKNNKNMLEDEYAIDLKDEKLYLPVEYVERKDRADAIMDIITKSLPNPQRLVTVMYYFDDMKISEISNALGCSEGTVKSRLFTAKKTIKEKIESKYGKSARCMAVLPLPLIMVAYAQYIEKLKVPRIVAQTINDTGKANILIPATSAVPKIIVATTCTLTIGSVGVIVATPKEAKPITNSLPESKAYIEITDDNSSVLDSSFDENSLIIDANSTSEDNSFAEESLSTNENASTKDSSSTDYSSILDNNSTIEDSSLVVDDSSIETDSKDDSSSVLDNSEDVNELTYYPVSDKEIIQATEIIYNNLMANIGDIDVFSQNFKNATESEISSFSNDLSANKRKVEFENQQVFVDYSKDNSYLLRVNRWKEKSSFGYDFFDYSSLSFPVSYDGTKFCIDPSVFDNLNKDDVLNTLMPSGYLEAKNAGRKCEISTGYLSILQSRYIFSNSNNVIATGSNIASWQESDGTIFFAFEYFTDNIVTEQVERFIQLIDQDYGVSGALEENIVTSIIEMHNGRKIILLNYKK